jgi:hypothetical protein
MLGLKVADGQRKVVMHLVTCISSAIICFGYMIIAKDGIDSAVLMLGLAAIGGHGMLNANANGKEHQSKGKSD